MAKASDGINALKAAVTTLLSSSIAWSCTACGANPFLDATVTLFSARAKNFFACMFALAVAFCSAGV